MEKIELYREALHAYEIGEPIMPDEKFDELKQELLSQGLISDQVGADMHSTHRHPSIMLSQKKIITANDFNNDHLLQIIKWLQKYDQSVDLNTWVYVSWKIDGVAFNAIYENGIREQVLTRSSSEEGDDITVKVSHLVPHYLEESFTGESFTGELRGEIFMKPSVFNEKYAEDYENTRNIIPGIIRSNDPNDVRKYDMSVLVFDGRDQEVNILQPYEIMGFVGIKKSHESFKVQLYQIAEMFYKFLKIRNEQEFPTDGFVIRLVDASKLGHDGKYPYHACCVKFKPVLAQTRIKKVQYNLKKTGRYVPKAILEPVFVDGSTVTKASLFSHNYVMNMKAFPGALVEVGKNGDIIPIIHSIVEPGHEHLLEIPENSFIDGAHLFASSDNDYIRSSKFSSSMYKLEIKDFGSSSFWKLAPIYDYNVFNVFDPKLLTYEHVSKALNGSNTINKFIESIKSIRKLSYATVINMMNINDCGWSHAVEIANWFRNKPYDFKNKNREVISMFTETLKDSVLFTFQILESYGIELYDYVPASQKSITFEMTGSPKPLFKTKEEFVAKVSNWSHTALKSGTTYLVTDSPESTTGKMGKAKSLSITIISYEQALEIHNKENQ